MARSGSSKGGGGSSRIRFIMLDAELNEGDLSQITQAMTNALNPTTIIQQRLIAAPVTGSINSDRMEIDKEAAEVIEVEPQPTAGDVPTRSVGQATAQRSKKYRAPKVIDVDLTSGFSFADFIAQKKPTNHQKRFLVVAAWFKQHRGMDAVTMDHV